MSNGRENQPPITPFALAMIVCDFIYQDPFTMKYTLIGTFSTIAASGFPLLHPQLFVYSALTGGRGRMPLRLEITGSAEEAEPIGVIRGHIGFGDDPRVVQEVGMGIPGLIFPAPDEYRLSLFVNDEFMVERRLLLYALPQIGAQNDE